jgi:hypothetical protein
MKPGRKFLEWCGEAVTTFANGFVRGSFVATGTGGVNAAATDTYDFFLILLRGVIAFFVVAGLTGLRQVYVWHESHPIPNPFKKEEEPHA